MGDKINAIPNTHTNKQQSNGGGGMWKVHHWQHSLFFVWAWLMHPPPPIRYVFPRAHNCTIHFPWSWSSTEISTQPPERRNLPPSVASLAHLNAFGPRFLDSGSLEPSGMGPWYFHHMSPPLARWSLTLPRLLYISLSGS